MKIKYIIIILVQALLILSILSVTTVSEENTIQWPSSWILIDSDPTENGPGDDFRDVQNAYYSVDDEYLYFRLECYGSPNFTAEPDGRYKWFIDIDDTHNMGQKGGNVFEAEYLLFVEDSPKPGGDGIGDIYLLNDVNGDGFIGDDWDDYLITPGKITDSSVASYRIDGNCMDICVRLTEISNPTNSYFTWSTDQENPNLDQAPDIDRSNNYWDTDLSKADIGIVKSDSADPICPGQSFTYTLLVTNHGPHATYNINVTDFLPSSLILDSANPAPTGGSFPNFYWNIAHLSVGESTIISLDVTTDGTTTGVITNTAVVYNDTHDPVLGNNNDIEETTIVEVADLGIIKSDDVDSVFPRDSFTYTLNVTSYGPYDSENVVVTDTLPDGVTFVNAIPTPSHISGSILSWEIPLLTVGESVDIILDVVVDDIASGIISNIAQVTSATYDPNLENNIASEDTVIDSAVDLEIVMSDDIDPVYPGQIFTYNIQVANYGPDAAMGVLVNDMLPGGVSFVSSNPAPSSNSGSVYYWNLGSIDAHGFTDIFIDVLVDGSEFGTVTNAAQVSCDTLDLNPINNAVGEDTFIIRAADLGVVKSDSVDPAHHGESFIYTLQLTNYGPHEAENVVLTDNLPVGISFISAVPTPSEVVGSTIKWNIPAFANAASETFQITVKVENSASGVLSNVAEVVSDTYDPVSENNIASEDTAVENAADLSISKSSDLDFLYPGDSLTYTIIVSDNGPDVSTNVNVGDMLPAGVSFVSANPAPSGNSGSLYYWNFASISSGESEIITIDVLVDPGSSGIITNNAEVTSDTYDPISENNMASKAVTIGDVADLSIEKTASADTVIVGAELTYLITVTNNGPHAAENVVVSDMLPADVTFLSADPAHSGNTGQTYNWNLALLGLGESFVIEVSVSADAMGTIINTAQVSSDTHDLLLGNNEDSVETNVRGIADLSIEKTSEYDEPVHAGSSIVYYLTVSNHGPDIALNVNVVDILPDGVTFVDAMPMADQVSGSEYRWIIVSMDVGESVIIRVNVTVDDGFSGTITNLAYVEEDSHDPDDEDDEDDDEIEVVPVADLSIEKTSEFVAPAHAGSLIVYTLNVTNHGPDLATNVNVTDILPDGVTFVDAMPTANEVSGSEYKWFISSLIVGESVVIKINVTVNESFYGIITNLAYVEEDSHDPDDEDDEDDDEIEVVSVSDLSIEKTSEFTEPLYAGDLVIYYLNVTNHGPDVALDVNVTDMLPNGVTFADSNLLPSGNSGSRYWWIIASMDVNESVIIRVNVTVNDSFSGTITNIATVEDDSYDPDDDNDEDDEDVTVDEEEDDDNGGGTTTGSVTPPPTVNEPLVETKEPSAVIAGEYYGTPGEEIEFDGTNSHDNDENNETITRYDWKFTDDEEWQEDIGPTPTYTYLEPGVYTVALRVFDDENSSNTTTELVTIVKPNSPPSTPEIVGPENGTQNTSYNFTIVSDDPDNDEIKYTIDWGDGTTTESGFLPSGKSFDAAHKWIEPGEYKIKITSDDDETISTEDITIEITEPEPEPEENNLFLPLLFLLLFLILMLLAILEKRRRNKKKEEAKIVKKTGKKTPKHTAKQ